MEKRRCEIERIGKISLLTWNEKIEYKPNRCSSRFEKNLLRRCIAVPSLKGLMNISLDEEESIRREI